MPNVSEEELQQLREDNESLRERLVKAQAKAAENDAARQREYEALQLGTENLQLEAQVAAAEQRAKVDASRQGAASVLDAAQERLQIAAAQAETPQGVPVDVNDPDNIKQGQKEVAAAAKASETKEGYSDTGSVPESAVTVPTTTPASAPSSSNGGNS
jgi:DNA repair exonuclease SbcCD ATPase subunit